MERKERGEETREEREDGREGERKGERKESHFNCICLFLGGTNFYTS